MNELISEYRRNGFVKVVGLLTREDALWYRDRALEACDRLLANYNGPIFDQNVNVWREDPAMRKLTLLPKLHRIAKTLAGVPLRLWHDQILIKRPHNNAPTEFHQDQPYWPHANSFHPISCWIALGDVIVESGCMTFIPGSQSFTELPAQNLADPKSLFEVCPELAWEPRVTIPLQAGDCTFHHGRCAHMAGANHTDDPRVAHAVIFMDSTTCFNGSGHVVTAPLNLPVGSKLDGELFPEI